jgi:NTP pyrophosphatase (non-canonical NTP hydrolase)
MEFRELALKADELTALYDQLNAEQGFPKWELEEYVQGLVEDVGSLVRLTMMKSGKRASFEELDEKLRHEVCDCLWSTLRIAKALNIDLETEFPAQMSKLAERVKHLKH